MPEPEANDGLVLKVPKEYSSHCRDLLKQHEEAWTRYQSALVDQRNKQGQKAASSETPDYVVDWKGKPYDSRQNQCTGNCLWSASKPHQKCKCQALYQPGMQHLVAPCDPTDAQGPALTMDQCKQLGYLDTTPMDGLGSNELKPIWPANTCECCREAFDALQRNFTPFTVDRVVECLDRVDSGSKSSSGNQTASSTFTSSDVAVPKKVWLFLAAALVLLILITVIVVYLVWSVKESNRSTIRECPPCAVSAGSSTLPAGK